VQEDIKDVKLRGMSKSANVQAPKSTLDRL